MVSPPLGDCDHLEPFPLATPLPVPLLGPRRRRYLRQCAVLLANHLLVILADTVECMPSCHPIIICCSIYLLSRRITTLTISNWGPFGGGGNHPGPQFCRAQDARRTRGQCMCAWELQWPVEDNFMWYFTRGSACACGGPAAGLHLCCDVWFDSC